MQGSRAECALARSVRKLIVLYFYDFRRRIVDALNILFFEKNDTIVSKSLEQLSTIKMI